MHEVAGYKLERKIYTGRNADIYKGQRISDGLAVIIKVTNRPIISEKNRFLFEQEFIIGKSINSERVVNYLDFIFSGSSIVIVEEYSGISLDLLIPPNGFPLLLFLKIAIQLAEGLHEIHEAGVIHKDVKPGNILIENLEAAKIKYSDFGLSSRIKEEKQVMTLAQELTASLAYAAPERSGRMNRAVGLRSDLYSLGVTLFELCTGRKPFLKDDPIELIYYHLTQPPPAPHNIKPLIPEMVSKIILKLLEKSPEDRYQSDYGLVQDLKKCLQLLTNEGQISEFEIGKEDHPFTLHIVEKLYGREKEMKQLLTGFSRACKGGHEVFMIAGKPGVGKSFLIPEIYKHMPLSTAQTSIIAGKFEQVRNNVAYSAIINAFKILLKRILMIKNENLNNWRKKILDILGDNVQVIIEAFPELEQIVGKQKPVPELRGGENQKRFTNAFRNFVQLFCSENQPLVLCIDDIHWADQSSLQLMQTLIEDTALKYFMLIGIYRDSELQDEHPTRQMLEIVSRKISIDTIFLHNLEFKDVYAWISETFGKESSVINEITQIIMQKTGGNPFFIKTFLQILYQEKIIFYQNGAWQWDIELIRMKPATENVAEMVAMRIVDLQQELQIILKTATCIGNVFDANEIAEVLNRDKTDEHLINALAAISDRDIIVRCGEKYCFTHDKVQEAVYSLMSEEEKKNIHVNVGRALLRRTDERKLQDNVYIIVEHFNKARDIVNDNEEALTLANLNLQAAKKAKASIAYSSSLTYLNCALYYQRNQDIWRDHYELALGIYANLAEVQYLCGNFVESQSTIYEIFPYLRNSIDAADIYNLLIIEKTMLGEYAEAINIGRRTLRLFDINLPKENFGEALQEHLVYIKKLLTNVKVEDLSLHQELVRQDHRAVMRVLYNVLAPCYIYDPILYSIVGLIMTEYSIENGNSMESCVGYSSYGMVACSFNDFQTGLDFANLSLNLSENRYKNQVQKARACTVLGLFVNHWLQPLNNSMKILEAGYNAGIKSGEVQFLGYILFGMSLIKILYGVSLQQVKCDIEKYLSYAKETNNKIAFDAIQSTYIAIKELKGEAISDSESFIKDCKINRSYVAIGCYYILKAQVAYLLGKFEEAERYVLLAEDFQLNCTGFVFISLINWWESLILIKKYKNINETEKAEILEKVKKNQHQMDIWAKSCPSNFLHRYLLVEAELCRINNDNWRAWTLFQEAKRVAKKNGYTFGEIFCNHLMADFLLENNDMEFAKEYVELTYEGYKAWGANIVADSYYTRYASLLFEPFPQNWEKSYQSGFLDAVNATRATSFNYLAIMDTWFNVVTQMDPEKLLRYGIENIVRNSSAQRGVFFFQTDDELTLQAEYFPDGSIETKQLPLQEWNRGCMLVINYVMRSHLPWIVGDAPAEQELLFDAYVAQAQCRTIVCIPIILQGFLIGLYYGESKVPFAFSQKHFDTVNIIAGQVGISYKNCQLLRSLTVSREDYRTLASVSPVGMFNIKNKKIIFINEIAREILGVGEQDAERINWMKNIHPDDLLLVKRKWEMSDGQDENFQCDFRFKHPNRGEIFVQTIAIRQIDEKGEFRYYFYINDNTDQIMRAKREQEEKLHLQRQEQDEIYKQQILEFINHLCHEIRNPMLTVSLGVDIISDMVDKLEGVKILFQQAAFSGERLSEIVESMKSNVILHDVLTQLQEINETSKLMANAREEVEKFIGEIREMIKSIKDSARHLSYISTSVLDRARMETSEIKINLLPSNPKEICENVISMYKPQADAKGLTLEFLTTDVYSIEIDPHHFNVLLVNFINNAIKYTERGKITLSLQYSNISEEDLTLIVVIKDTGIGMSADMQTRLFTRFMRQTTTTYNKSPSSGFGLFYAKKLLDAMGATVNVQSAEGMGSEFIITLPCKRSKITEGYEEKKAGASSSYIAPLPSEGAKKYCILIVEDNIVNRMTVAKTLKILGHDYLEAADGATAYDIYIKQHSLIDCILMDIQMPPGINGFVTTEKIRMFEINKNLAKTPIICTTGDLDDKAKAQEVGMNGYLIKPFTKDALSSCLQKCLTSTSKKKSELPHLVA